MARLARIRPGQSVAHPAARVRLPRWATRLSGGDRRALITCGIALYLLALAAVVGLEWSRDGLFYSLGVDWSRFFGATRAYALSGPGAAYRLDAITRNMQPLGHYYGPQAGALKVGPAPYPPIALALFLPFTLPPPPIGFLLWTVVNLALVLGVARALAVRCCRGSWRMTLLLALWYPAALALFVGQMIGLLVASLYLGYRALEDGNDLQAGWWLGMLLVKPQYAAVLVLVLIMKRRWRAVGGVTLAGLAIVLASLAVGGTVGIAGYVAMVAGPFLNYGGAVAVDPSGMINWRGLLSNVFPGLPAVQGIALTAALSAATLATLPIVWKGHWDPRGDRDRFAMQMLATMAATLLVAYHSQLHGAALLMIPAALVATRRVAPRLLRWLILFSLFALPVLAGVTRLGRSRYELASMAFVATMALAICAIVVDRLAHSPAAAAPATE